MKYNRIGVNINQCGGDGWRQKSESESGRKSANGNRRRRHLSARIGINNGMKTDGEWEAWAGDGGMVSQ